MLGFVEEKKNNINNRGKDETEMAGILYPLNCSDREEGQCHQGWIHSTLGSIPVALG